MSLLLVHRYTVPLFRCTLLLRNASSGLCCSLRYLLSNCCSAAFLPLLLLPSTPPSILLQSIPIYLFAQGFCFSISLLLCCTSIFAFLLRHNLAILSPASSRFLAHHLPLSFSLLQTPPFLLIFPIYPFVRQSFIVRTLVLQLLCCRFSFCNDFALLSHRLSL